LIERTLEVGGLKGELEQIREAHRILIDQMERLDERLTTVAETVADDAYRSEELADGVQSLESLVQRLQSRRAPRRPPSPTARPPPSNSGPTPACWRLCAARSPKTASTFSCSRSSACRSARRCSTRASRGCATSAAR
ncbi:MAG: hypothetical protein ABI655_03910, partial [Phenylobacterium sp.]